MTDASRSGARPAASARNFYAACAAQANVFRPLALLATRLLVARVFLLSGLTKWDGMSIRDDAFYLFADEYFAKYALPQPVTDAFTIAAAVGEVVLPLLLIAGLFTRFASAGLLVMTGVIQVFVYPGEWWSVHAWWATAFALVVAVGPGAWSVDRWLGLDR